MKQEKMNQMLNDANQGQALKFYKNIINIGRLLSKDSEKGNIFELIKKYIEFVDNKNKQYFIDFAFDYQTGSFSSHHYCVEEFQKRLKQNADEFLHRLNKDYLYPNKLEITANHGLQKTFRFWSDLEKQTYIHSATYIIRALQDMSRHICFGYGTALAAKRSGQFIPHDDDLDIILYVPGHFPDGRAGAIEHVKNFLHKKGIQTGQIFPTHLHVHASDKMLDVFVAVEKDNRLDWIPGPEEGIPFEMIFPVRQMELEDILCDFPQDIENYLCTLYGPDWQTPDTNFHHVWR